MHFHCCVSKCHTPRPEHILYKARRCCRSCPAVPLTLPAVIIDDRTPTVHCVVQSPATTRTSCALCGDCAARLPANARTKCALADTFFAIAPHHPHPVCSCIFKTKHSATRTKCSLFGKICAIALHTDTTCTRVVFQMNARHHPQHMRNVTCLYKTYALLHPHVVHTVRLFSCNRYPSQTRGVFL